MKVRTTLIGGEKKMLVWNDLEADEKIKVYDKGVEVTSGKGVYDLLVSYRSGDIWAPKVDQTEALKVEVAVLRRLRQQRHDALQRRRGRPARGADARGGRPRRFATAGGWSIYERQSLCRIAPDVKLGKNVKLSKFINLYGCTIGDNTKIGAFVEIQKNARIGTNCKISSHTFICEGVTIEDDVFVGHSVAFINDTYPRATAAGRRAPDRGRLEGGEHPREERRLHRLRRDHPGQRDDRRERHRRRRQRRHQRRPPQHHRRRQPGQGVLAEGSRIKGQRMNSAIRQAQDDSVNRHTELPCLSSHGELSKARTIETTKDDCVRMALIMI